MKYRNRLLALVLSVVILVSLSACGGGGNTDPSTEPSPSNGGSGYNLPDVTLENKKIRFFVGMGTTLESLSSTNPDRPSPYDLFKKKYGGEIELINVEWTDYYTTLLSYYMGDDMPDLLWPMPETFPVDIINNLIQPVDEYKDYIDLSEPIWDRYRDYIEMMAINGKHYYAITGFGSSHFLVYNPKLFDLYGLEKPLDIYKNDPESWDWNKLLELAKELTDDTNDDGVIDQWGFAIGGNGPVCFQESTGVPFISYDPENGITNNIRSQEIADAANFIRDMGPSLHNVLDPSASHEAYQSFLSGGVAMISDMSWRITGAYKDLWKEGKIEVAPFPRYPKTDKFYKPGLLWSFLIANKAKNPEGSALYLTLCGYQASEFYNKDYGDETDESKYASYLEIGIPLEQAKLMHEVANDHEKHPVVLNLWLGWYDKGWYTGLTDLKNETWSQIVERVAPIFDKRIESRLEEFNAIVKGESGN